ncbi:hypothetical protein GQ457_08G037290 [Hibiscus cannabinus]
MRCLLEIVFSLPREPNTCLDDVHMLFLVGFRVASWFKAKIHYFECLVNSLISDLSLVDKLHMCKLKPPKIILWEPPPLWFLKLNVDGAMVNDNSKGGIGGVIRNSKGVRLASFSLPIGPGLAILEELEAISHGLEYFYSLLGLIEQSSSWNVIAHWRSTGSIIQPCVLRSLALWLGSARTVLKRTPSFFDISQGFLTWKQIALLKRESGEG